MQRQRLLAVAAVALVAAGSATVAAPAQAAPRQTAAPQPAATQAVVTWAASTDRTSTPINGQTVRNILTTNVGGTGLQVRLSNEFGRIPVTFDSATIGLVSSGAALVPGTNRRLSFDGSPSVTVAPGESVQSDPLTFPFPARSTVAVSVYTQNTLAQATGHNFTARTNYLSTAGDHTTESGAASFTTTTENWLFVESLTVQRVPTASTVVAFGDSITDGVGSDTDVDNRYPDYLAERYLALPVGQRKGVANEGISGNRVTRTGAGQAAVTRFQRDALDQPGVETVILLEGINDLNTGVTADQVIRGYRDLIAQAHADGTCLVGATVTPYESATPEVEAYRQELNDFIRTSGEFDGVVDFDAVIRDPSDRMMFIDLYDSGDGLHPSDEGYEAMADSIPLPVLECGR